jgi:hypothetical protein
MQKDGETYKPLALARWYGTEYAGEGALKNAVANSLKYTLYYHNKENDKYVYCDTSIESPVGRRSFCYDIDALNSRKSNKPNSDIMTEANNNMVKVLDEAEYKYLQSLGDFDLKSSSWILTPMEIRKLGGALFGDKKYNRTFIYHNGAESYYSNRGFRVLLKI